MAEKPCHDIRKVEKYVDSAGREVLTFTQVFGKEQEEPLVKGTVYIQVNTVAPNGMRMPPQNIRLEFAFPSGTGIKAAFEKFDEVAKAEVERFKTEHKERMNANRVVGARAMSGILGPDGKFPLKAGG